jgi:copper chaperone CopZ
MTTIRLKVSGMHCGRCQGKVEDALKSVNGTYSAEVDLAEGSAVVDFDGKAPADRFVAAVVAAGYGAEVTA